MLTWCEVFDDAWFEEKIGSPIWKINKSLRFPQLWGKKNAWKEMLHLPTSHHLFSGAMSVSTEGHHVFFGAPIKGGPSQGCDLGGARLVGSLAKAKVGVPWRIIPMTCKWFLREPQHTPGAYPRPPQTPKWKEFLHKLLVLGLRYVPGVCWKILGWLINMVIVSHLSVLGGSSPSNKWLITIVRKSPRVGLFPFQMGVLWLFNGGY